MKMSFKEKNVQMCDLETNINFKFEGRFDSGYFLKFLTIEGQEVVFYCDEKIPDDVMEELSNLVKRGVSATMEEDGTLHIYDSHQSKQTPFPNECSRKAITFGGPESNSWGTITHCIIPGATKLISMNENDEFEKKEKELESNLKSRLNDEFLATLVEACRVAGHGVGDLVETQEFVKYCFEVAEKEIPSSEELEAYLG